MVRELALHEADLAGCGAEAAELGRDGEGEESGIPEAGEPLFDERALVVVTGSVASEVGGDDGGPLEQRVVGDAVDRGRHGTTVRPTCAPL